MSTLELKKKGAEYFNSLDDKTKQLIINVMHSTVDMCNDFNAEYNHPMKEIDTYRYGRKEIGRYLECSKGLAGTPAFYG